MNANTDAISLTLLLAKLTLLICMLLMSCQFFKRRSASFRHAILTIGLGCLPFLVVFHFLAPSWSMPFTRSIASKPATFLEPNHLDLTPTDLELQTTCAFENEAGNLDSTTSDSSVISATKNSDSALTTSAKCDVYADDQTEKTSLETSNAKELVVLQTESGGASQILESTLATESSSKRFAFNWALITLLVWLVGVLILLTRVLLAWVVVSNVTRKSLGLTTTKQFASIPVSTRQLIQRVRSQGIQVKVSNSAVQSPLGFGIFKKTILIPSNCFAWSDGQWRSVLLHELAHFRRYDCLTNLIARTQQAVLWFHPLAWIYVSQIRAESENACDDFVIRSGISQVEYADVLVNVARQSVKNRHLNRHLLVATVAMSDATPLESRVASILSAKTLRLPVSRRTLVAAVILLMCFAIPVSTAQLASSALDVDNQAVALQADDKTKEELTPISETDSNTEENIPPNLRYFVTLNDGKTFIGSNNSELEIISSFGRSFLNVNQVRLIKSRKDKPDQFKIETTDGSYLLGSIKGDSITFAIDNGEDVNVLLENLTSASLLGQSNLVAGEISNGFAKNNVTYHIRAPRSYDPTKKYPALVLLHESDSNSKTVIENIAARWPEIAQEYLLIGINGERKSETSTDEGPAYNYTYVNFVGASKYKGFPGTERESPALVAEVIQEIQDYVPISKIFLGGHSDGAWLTYSMYMNYPNLLDGAFPISGAMIIQCQPDAYDDELIRKQQRDTPIVIIHPDDDLRLEKVYTMVAHQRYLDDGFPMLRVMTADSKGSHLGGNNLPHAIRWLETMSARSSKGIRSSIETLVAQDKPRDAIGLLTRLDLDSLPTTERDSLLSKTDFGGSKTAAEFETLVTENKSNQWIEDFLAFRKTHEFAPAAQTAMDQFNQLRATHDESADELFNEIRQLFDDGKDAEAYAKCELIVDKYYAARRYRYAKKKLANREAEPESQE